MPVSRLDSLGACTVGDESPGLKDVMPEKNSTGSPVRGSAGNTRSSAVERDRFNSAIILEKKESVGTPNAAPILSQPLRSESSILRRNSIPPLSTIEAGSFSSQSIPPFLQNNQERKRVIAPLLPALSSWA